MPELRVVLPERGQRTVLQTEANAVPADGFDRRGLAVGEPGGRIVAREAHPVAPAKLHRLASVDLDSALRGGDALRPPRRQVALGVLQAQHAPAPVDAGDPALVALLDPERLVGAGEDHRVADGVAGRAGHLRAGEIARHQLLALAGGAGDRAFGDQPVPDRGVDGVAQRPRRGDHPGRRALLVRQVEPAPRGLGSEIAILHLPDVVAELRERALHVAGQARPDRRLELGVALANDVVHHRRGHPGGLQLLERLAGLDRAELFLVADQHHARQAERGRDPEQIAHLLAGGERGFVHHQHRHVPAGPVRDAAVNLLAPETAAALACPGPDPGNLAFEHRPEALGIDRTGEAERLGAPARPGARLPVRAVVPGVVAIALEIAHPLRRRGDLADGRYHRGSPATEAD